MNEFNEGYADGIAGAGMQDRQQSAFTLDQDLDARRYKMGFVEGSIDRKAMLANAERGTC